MNFDMFVETEIMAISIVKTSQEYTVSISIVDHENNHWVLTAYSIVNICIDSLLEVNIIDRICLLNEKNTDSEKLRKKIFFLFRDEYADYENSAWCFVDETIQRIKASENILLEVEPVAGAYILLVAKNISLENKDK